MAEIKTEPMQIMSPGVFISNSMTWADIARWVIAQGGQDEMIDLLSNVSQLQGD